MQDDPQLEDLFAQHQNPVSTARQYEFVIGHYIQHIVELHLKWKANYFLQINMHELRQLYRETMTFSKFQNNHIEWLNVVIHFSKWKYEKINVAIQHNETTTIKRLVLIGIKETYLTDEKPRWLYCCSKYIFRGTSYHMHKMSS